MRREIAATTLAAVTVFGVGGSEMPNAVDFAGHVASFGAPSELTVVDLPKTLPPAVEAQVPNTVAFKASVPAEQHIAGQDVATHSRHEWLASGVRIDRSVYLTAGHAVLARSRTVIPGLAVCGNAHVSVPTKQTSSLRRAADGSIISLTGIGLTLEAVSTPPVDAREADLRDVALVRVNPQDEDMAIDAPTVTLADEVTVGEPVYAINYEPTQAGQFRTPNQADLDTHDRDKLALYANPAQIGGMVLRVLPNGSFVMLTGLKGYGAAEEPYVLGGASGGPVFTSTGQLAGITVGGAAQVVTTAAEIENAWHVSLDNVEPTQRLDFAIVQPISQKRMEDMKSQLAAAEPCSPTD